MIKTGTRLESRTCSTQVIVVAAAESLDDLRCGGATMATVGAAKQDGISLDEKHSGGTLIGKRYVTDDGAEVLVTKPGAGSLSVGDTPLHVRDSKALPASD
ncbi:hypothetical protein [Rhodococcus sp. SJ-3]|uniref:hypothetical protein n=1 Tax=Rhodococcus sp. SJ-3 TaxID=3454628 RepID=UPI003F7AD785